MRLIDADALIEVIEMDDKASLLSAIWALSIIDEAPTIPTVEPQRWIPVTERLPEYGEKCLITAHTAHAPDIDRTIIITSTCYVQKEGFWLPFAYKVTAWMPLPKPWKGEEDADNNQI